MAGVLDLWRGPSLTRLPRDISTMNSMFEKMLESWPEVRPLRTLGENFDFSPSCEVTEDDHNYLLKFDLPGVPKDQVKIELNDNQLTVSATRSEEKKKDTKATHLSEICYGSYTRTFSLPSAVDDKKVDARFENGVLSVTVPKTEASKAKQISIH